MAGDAVIRARVAHHTPGRLRLRLEPGTGVAQSASRIESTLSNYPGFSHIEQKPAARSVVVHYNPAQLELQHLLDEGLVAASVELLEDGAHAVAKVANGTRVGHRIVNSVSAVNSGIGRATGGVLDLRDLFPLTLFGFGVRRLLQGNLQPMPWYNLLYYGYSTFYALHGRKPAPAAPSLSPLEILQRRYVQGEIGEEQFARMRLNLEAGGGIG